MARMSTLILLSAIPGAGKSTWAKDYQRNHPNTYIVASDDVRCRVSGGIQCFQNEAKVWEVFLQELQDYSKQECTVIADATNLQNRYRRYYYENTPGFDHHILVVFHVPFELCMEQNRMRSNDRVVSDEGMKSLYAEFEEPTQDIIDLYDEYIDIHEDYVERRVK